MNFLVGFKVQGLAELIASLNGASARLDQEIEKRMGLLVLEVAGRAQSKIVGSRATNPPERLGVVTGRLRQAITGIVRRKGPGIVQGVVSPQGVRYAAVHELGSAAIGQAAMNIPARPYLAPAIQELQERIVQVLGDGFSASVVFGSGSSR